MIRCKACGTEYEDGASYCPNCFALSEKTQQEVSFTEEGASEVSTEVGADNTGNAWDSYIESQREEDTRKAAEARQLLAHAAEARGAAAAVRAEKSKGNEDMSAKTTVIPVVAAGEAALPEEESGQPSTQKREKAKSGAGVLLAAIFITAAVVLLLCGSIFYFLLRADILSIGKASTPAQPATVDTPTQAEQPDAEPNLEPEQESILCTGLTLKEAELILKPGEAVSLQASASPNNVTEPLVWSTTDHGVVTVEENGTITAVGKGTAAVLVSCGDYGCICNITVAEASPESEGGEPENEPITEPETELKAPKLNYTDITMQAPGEKVQLILENVGDTPVIWTSSNEKVAPVDENGCVTAIGTGTVKVTAEADGKTYTCVVRCPLGGVEGETLTVTLNYSDVTMNTIGESFTLRVKYAVEPENPSKVTWTSSNADWCTVDENGKVTVMAGGWTGTVTITAEVDGVKLRCIVRCNAPIPE